MKKLLLTMSLISGIIFSGYANLNGNGFYRVKNYGSSRWATLIDNYASVDFFAGSADLHSLLLTNDTEEILSDPGSVVYITKKSNNQYDIAGQGVTLEGLVNNTISIRSNGTAPNGQDTYMIYGIYKNATKFIGDANIFTNEEYGIASLNVTNENFNKWYIMPLDVNSSNYFGAVPTVTANGNLYTSLFTSFAYKPYSKDVEAYYVGRVGYGMAELVEITGAVPPGSPVIIKCAGKNVADNKLQIVEDQTTLPVNSLTGVYFDYSGNSHVNRVKYDPNTMRVLGVCSDGSLGFVKAELEYIPANTAYLKVPNGSAPEIKCVSPEVYEQKLPEAPEYFSFGENNYTIYPQGEDNYTGTFDIPANPDGSDLLIKFNASSSVSNEENFIGAYSANTNVKDGRSYLPFAYNSPYSWIFPNWDGGNLQITINLQYQYVYFYLQTAGITAVYNGNSSLVFDGETIKCENGREISIYNLEGIKVLGTQGNNLNVSNLPKGIYVAKSQDQTLKFKL